MDCLFCKIIKGDINSYKLYEDEKVICFLDINPMSKGHTLIVPKHHYKDIEDISTEELNYINVISKKMVTIIQKTFNPIGIRLVQNNGSIQEIKHYHLHIIPIYSDNKKENIEDVYTELKKNC